MWDSIQNLRFRAGANIMKAQEEMNIRLNDRMELPLPGIHGERLFLTGASNLRKRATELTKIYESLPDHHGVQDTILLDAWSSATVEGARTTVAQVKRSLSNPQTKDDRMVVNAISGSEYAYDCPITGGNIRRLWETVVDGVCENAEQKGKLYRDGMVYIGKPIWTASKAPTTMTHTPSTWMKFTTTPMSSPPFCPPSIRGNGHLPMWPERWICSFRSNMS